MGDDEEGGGAVDQTQTPSGTAQHPATPGNTLANVDLRHLTPQILTVQHPLEESRDCLAFATEPVFASLVNL